MGISVWQILILLAVIILIFGTKKFKNIGSDLGSAIKGFKSTVQDSDENNKQLNEVTQDSDKKTTTEPI